MTSRYSGYWQRRWLDAPPSPVDAQTQVSWLQTTRLYCDLRIPATRPSLTGRECFEDCSLDELRALTCQEGFAGHLEAVDNLCYWHRHFDFQPRARVPDAGWMNWAHECVHETGVFANYTEEWAVSRADVGTRFATKLFVRHASPALRPLRQGVLVVVGDRFMFALERAVPANAGDHWLAEAFAGDDRVALQTALDCEISAGLRRHGNQPWEVTHSTIPFLEGHPLFTASELPCTGLIPPRPMRASLEDAECFWLIDEATSDFTWDI